VSAPLLEVSGLSKHFKMRGGGVIRAVEDVGFTLEHGRALALVGESGCGKSTVARCLLGLARPTAGSIALDGVELARLSPRGAACTDGGCRSCSKIRTRRSTRGTR